MQKRSNIIRYQKLFCKILANSRAMITKQQITINYTEESSIKRYKKKKKLSDMKKIIGRFRPILCLRAQKNNLELIILKKLTSKLTQKKKKK